MLDRHGGRACGRCSTPPPAKIRGPRLLDAAMKKQIEDGSPRHAIVPPKSITKCLVTESRCTPGHYSLPHGTYMLEMRAQEYLCVLRDHFQQRSVDLLKYQDQGPLDAIWHDSNSLCVHWSSQRSRKSARAVCASLHGEYGG